MRKKIKYNLGGIPLGAPASLNPLGPNQVTSSAYGMLNKSLQPTMDMQPFIDANTPAGTGTIGGSGMGMANLANMGLGSLEQELALPQNEFDQAQQTITKVKKAGNIIKRGRDAVQHARNVKKAADVASAAGGDVGSLLGNLGAQGVGEAAKQTAKTGVNQLIANAGASKFGTFLSSGAGAAASAGAGILGKAIQEIDKKDGNYSTAGAMGGGALQGAAIGSALGPIGAVAGAAIGAGVGALQKKKFEQAEISKQETAKTDAAIKQAKNQLQGRALLQTFPVEGIKEQVYAHGGEHNPVPGEKMVIADPVAEKPFQMRLETEQEANMTSDQRKKRSDRIGKDYKHLYDAFSESEIAEYDKYFNKNYPNVHLSIYSFTDRHNQFKRDPLPELMQSKGLPESSRPELVTNLAQNQVPRVVGQDEYYIDPMRARSAAGFRGGHQDGKYAMGVRRTFENPDGTRFTNTEPYDTEHRDINRINALDRNRFRTSASFKYGGHTNNPDYLAEGGEMIQHAPGDLPKTDFNGSVTPVTKTIARINGDKHIAASGGVGMEGEKPARIYSDQLEVPAELIKQLSKL